ncbi:hypothetical protein [Bifidobacterium thermophilum]|uniref:hypothetical protein n=1 Tax=Bifidobacterium thermophilum TaxID=33905 RepID=UPI003F922114
MCWASLNAHANRSSAQRLSPSPAGEAVTAPQIADRSILIDADIDTTLRNIASRG